MYKTFFGIGLVMLALAVSTAHAGSLDGNAGAYLGWTGSTTFDNGEGLSGYVDYCVFEPGQFSDSGYAAPAGEFVYAYQVFSTGPDWISSFAMAVQNAANTEGTMVDLLGVDATGAIINAGSEVRWTFADLGIDQGSNSVGLVFASPNAPEALFGTVVDGGGFSYAYPLPAPSAFIPEPATMGLLALGSLAMLRRRRN
jgi:hypothetical protein